MSYYEEKEERSGLGPFLFVMIVTASVGFGALFTCKKIKEGNVAALSGPNGEQVEPSAGLSGSGGDGGTTPEIRGPGALLKGPPVAPGGPGSDQASVDESAPANFSNPEDLVAEFSARLGRGEFSNLDGFFGQDEQGRESARAATLVFRAVGERLGYRPVSSPEELERTDEGPVYALDLASARSFESHPTPSQTVFLKTIRSSSVSPSTDAISSGIPNREPAAETWVISRVEFPHTLRQSAMAAVTDGLPAAPFSEEEIARLKQMTTSPVVEAPGLASPEIGTDRPIGTASRFLRSVLSLDYEEARKLADFEKVQGEKVAALCFVFEEGQFELAEDTPLVITATSDEASWGVAKVRSQAWNKEAEFGLEMAPADNGEWQVVGLNFSSLLSAYAQASAAGEVAFTPLVDSPEGGQSLALFFKYDDARLHPRAERQLNIVADMLRQDSSKEIRVTGHADARGSEDYNEELSRTRAVFVKEYLLARGVDVAQIKTTGAGESLPLRPNSKADGTDDPDGRAHNRRAEMYLDF